VIKNFKDEQTCGDRVGQWSIRINEQYRICFQWREIDAYDVEIVDYH
jgi:proteic killer suppression protein